MRIKNLEWRESCFGFERTENSFIEFVIRYESYDCSYNLFTAELLPRKFNTMEEAKEYAQEYFNQLIMENIDAN